MPFLINSDDLARKILIHAFGVPAMVELVGKIFSAGATEPLYLRGGELPCGKTLPARIGVEIRHYFNVIKKPK